jgi:hypothetical protein
VLMSEDCRLTAESADWQEFPSCSCTSTVRQVLWARSQACHSPVHCKADRHENLHSQAVRRRSPDTCQPEDIPVHSSLMESSSQTDSRPVADCEQNSWPADIGTSFSRDIRCLGRWNSSIRQTEYTCAGRIRRRSSMCHSFGRSCTDSCCSRRRHRRCSRSHPSQKPHSPEAHRLLWHSRLLYTPWAEWRHHESHSCGPRPRWKVSDPYPKFEPRLAVRRQIQNLPAHRPRQRTTSGCSLSVSSYVPPV